MNGVDLAGVTFGQIPVLTVESDDIEVVGAEGGPLIYRTRTSADQEAIVLAFDIGLSNLPVRVAFPILVANVVDDLVDRGLPASLAAGDPLTLTVGSDVAAVSITLPDGTVRTVPTSEHRECIDKRSHVRRDRSARLLPGAVAGQRWRVHRASSRSSSMPVIRSNRTSCRTR